MLSLSGGVDDPAHLTTSPLWPVRATTRSPFSIQINPMPLAHPVQAEQLFCWPAQPLGLAETGVVDVLMLPTVHWHVGGEMGLWESFVNIFSKAINRFFKFRAVGSVRFS
jgi:hypothetical protein